MKSKETILKELEGSIKAVRQARDRFEVEVLHGKPDGLNSITVDILDKRLAELETYYKLVEDTYSDIPKYVSEDGVPLVSQYTREVPVLTVEDYDKWYDLYLIMPDGEVRTVGWDQKELQDGWRDHCIVPYNMHKLAQDNGWYLGWEVMERVYEMYSEYVSIVD
ncbi:hypothetical protein [Bacillus subtilis]|uniref:hypothetical protein n=1 Tax=Bacillus subtilis TaxID=1423 RepID=UPI0025C783DC|nr:hypothetical protein [Bacillus subtilis]GLI90468.1 hypothetical protein ANABIO4_38200 [Bacillus subtilis]